MAILKSGGTAVDAVEAAIKNLEDNELTNAGYGSNLTLTGNVECDATIIDHLGRSGSVGAVSSKTFFFYASKKHELLIMIKFFSRYQKPNITCQSHS